MNSPATVFLAINEVLQDIEVQQIKESKTMQEMRVIARERSEVQGEIHRKLEGLRVRFEKKSIPSKSSFAVTEIPVDDPEEGSYKIRLIYKQKGGGGSGAGAALTKLSESAQCMYAALAWKNNGNLTTADVTCENFNHNDVKSKTITDEKYESMCSQLPDDWIKSCLAGANKLHAKYGSGNYTFHRGSPLVNQIEANFKRVKKAEGLRMDLNKWSPADIYLVRKDFQMKCIAEEKSILGLNACMRRELDAGRLIGVSLKKITGQANLKPMNQKGTTPEIKYNGYELSPDSMDGYLKVKVNGGNAKIQFRSFGGNTSLTGWQGEVKGKSAAAGKIGGGVLESIMVRNSTLTKFPYDNETLKRLSSDPKKNPQFLEELYNMFVGVEGSKMKKDAFIKAASANRIGRVGGTDWRFSKYRSLFFVSQLEDNKRIAGTVCDNIAAYSMSQSDEAAPHVVYK